MEQQITLHKNNFWSEVKKHLISALVGAILVGIPFYFKTNASLEKDRGDITELQTAYKSVSSNIADINLKMSIASTQPYTMNQEIQELKKEISSLSARQDKMYEILLDWSRKN